MKHPVDNLLPNSRSQALKALLVGSEPLPEPWWMRWLRAIDVAVAPKEKVR